VSDLDHSAASRLARSFIGSAGEPLRLEKRIASIGRFGRAEGESHLSLKIEHSESSALTQDGLSPMRLQSFAHSTLGMKRSNVSDTTVPSAHLNARPLMSRGVGIYFGILSALTFIALLPGAITIGLLLFILPGRALVASGTLLYYSLAVLPGYFIARHLGNRPLAVAVAAICLAAAALLPHYVSGYLLGRVVAYDHSIRRPRFNRDRSSCHIRKRTSCGGIGNDRRTAA
jgi:VIT1/CCC1 family predicted Fe2+/Mn2+ transporter